MFALTLEACLERVAALGEVYLLRGGGEDQTAAALLAWFRQEVPQLLPYPVALTLPDAWHPGAIYELDYRGQIIPDPPMYRVEPCFPGLLHVRERTSYEGGEDER